PFTAGVTTKSGSLLAALAHGVPVLATAADEPDPDLVDGDTVLVIPQRRDPPAIAATIRRLLDRPAEAATVARRGAAWAATRDWPAVAAAHVALYSRAVGE
ncbi:MAG: glycosyltransferase, partial [Actinomycetes bacterium]